MDEDMVEVEVVRTEALTEAFAAYERECEHVERLRQQYAPDAAPWKPAAPNTPPVARRSDRVMTVRRGRAFLGGSAGRRRADLLGDLGRQARVAYSSRRCCCTRFRLACSIGTMLGERNQRKPPCHG